LKHLDLKTNHAYQLITREDEARRAIDALEQEPIVGLDTETYWDAARNQARVSLVQIASREKEVIVVDLLAVDVKAIQALIESPKVMMAAHNARFDEGVLRSAGLNPASFVDTLRLARTALPALPSYSLASVTAHLFGLELDKSLQKSNWRRRPLARAQLLYAATDANLALRVFQKLQLILKEQNCYDEALQDALLQSTSDATAMLHRRRRRAPLPPLARPLTVEEQSVVARLKRWRMERSAQEGHIPAYMICADRTLEQLAMERPTSLDALNAIYGLGASRISRYGEELLRILASSDNAK
jgi:ribonuclease D